MELRTHETIRDIGEDTWRTLSAGAPPFSSFAWLDALERTGCVRPERGWLPMHLTLEEDGRVIAAAPAYLKGNSEGEFVFDHAWAGFCERRLGIDYYPKIILAVPFTPATGPRILSAPGVDRARVYRAFAEGLRELPARLSASSAHVLFPPDEEASALAELGLARRSGLQFHWQNQSYASFDDFLARFDAKRRHQIRRERRELRSQGLVVESRLGSELGPAEIDLVFELYLTTVNKYFWGRQYLNREFFHEVCRSMGDSLDIVLAREAGARRPLACAFNILGEHALYGRYWGAFEERPFLHFEVCYYHGIEQCIARGLERFEPGAGGEHKVARGFMPTVTHSVHALADRRLDRAVRDFLREEREAIDDHVAEALRESRLRVG